MQTFMFTDIESSTRLWEEHPTEMADSLARHDSILTEAIEKATRRRFGAGRQVASTS